MSVRDHDPTVYERFNGLWSRGANYNCPLNYDITCNNTVFPSPGEKEQRSGFTQFIDISSMAGPNPSVQRFWIYRVNPTTVFYLFLDLTNGRIYQHNNLAVPILTVAGMIDFSINIMFGRCYITPHDLSFGIINEFVYVWDGNTPATAARKAAGVRPNNATPIAITDTAAGKIEIGDHVFGVVYETTSGFITAPGPYNGAAPNYTLWAAPPGTGTGFLPNRNASLTAIPLGPAGTSKRHIVATKVIFNYNGNPEASEFFFVPNGNIDDNLTTVKVVDFFDSDLIKSADYLFDQMPELPAVVSFSTFNLRQILIGPNNWTMANGTKVNGRQALVSKSADPESFDAIGGTIQNDDTSGGGFKNGAQLRDGFFLFCEGRIYQTRDNGLTPSQWPLDLVDAGHGGFCNTVAPVATVKGGQIDYLIVGDRVGCYAFNGAVQLPLLSYPIEKYWDEVTIASAIFGTAIVRTLNLVIDPDDQILYIGGNDLGRSLLTMDFKDGLSASTVKWSPWNIVTRPDNGGFVYSISQVVVDIRPSTQRQVPMIMTSFGGVAGLGASRVNFLNPTGTQDTYGTGAGTNGTAYIRTRWRFAFTPTDPDVSQFHYGGLRYYATIIEGGVLNQPIFINAYDLRDNPLITLDTLSINIGASLASQWQSLNLKGERISLELNYNPGAGFSTAERFRLQKLTVFSKVTAGSLPMQGI